MKKIKFNILLIFFIPVLFSCNDNTVEPTIAESLIFQYDGLIEEVGGDCSAVQARTRSYGSFDLTNSNRIKFKFNGMSDADLSSISFYYINENDEQIFLVNLTDRDQINNTNSIEVDSPGINTEIFSRVTLKSSVCTGQIFFLSLRDLKIYSITQ